MIDYQYLETLFIQLLNVGPILPGSINEQDAKCGKKGCRCMKSENPQKHTRFQLSYTLENKRTTLYVRKAELESTKHMTDAYREMRKLITALSLESVRISRIVGATEAANKMSTVFKKSIQKTFGIKCETQIIRKLRESRDNWKKRAIERKKALDKLTITNRDLKLSRKKWREEALMQRKKILSLEVVVEEKNKTKHIVLKPEKKN